MMENRGNPYQRELSEAPKRPPSPKARANKAKADAKRRAAESKRNAKKAEVARNKAAAKRKAAAKKQQAEAKRRQAKAKQAAAKAARDTERRRKKAASDAERARKKNVADQKKRAREQKARETKQRVEARKAKTQSKYHVKKDSNGKKKYIKKADSIDAQLMDVVTSHGLAALTGGTSRKRIKIDDGNGNFSYINTSYSKKGGVKASASIGTSNKKGLGLNYNTKTGLRTSLRGTGIRYDHSGSGLNARKRVPVGGGKINLSYSPGGGVGASATLGTKNKSGLGLSYNTKKGVTGSLRGTGVRWDSSAGKIQGNAKGPDSSKGSGELTRAQSGEISIAMHSEYQTMMGELEGVITDQREDQQLAKDRGLGKESAEKGKAIATLEKVRIRLRRDFEAAFSDLEGADDSKEAKKAITKTRNVLNIGAKAIRSVEVPGEIGGDDSRSVAPPQEYSPTDARARASERADAARAAQAKHRQSRTAAEIPQRDTEIPQDLTSETEFSHKLKLIRNQGKALNQQYLDAYFIEKEKIVNKVKELEDAKRAAKGVKDVFVRRRYDSHIKLVKKHLDVLATTRNKFEEKHSKLEKMISKAKPNNFLRKNRESSQMHAMQDQLREMEASLSWLNTKISSDIDSLVQGKEV